MEKLYTAVVTAKGGRDGHIRSSDGVIDLELKAPKAMGGSEDGYANLVKLISRGCLENEEGNTAILPLEALVTTPAYTPDPATVSAINQSTGAGLTSTWTG